MATPAQIAANRANSQKSTGPTSEAGKTKTSQNAIRHGLCCCITCMDDEDSKEMEALLADLMEEHKPQGPTEQILVYKMAEQFWFTKRASHYITVYTMYNEGRDEEDGDNAPKQLALYLRYYTSADRGFNKNLHDLRKLQKERRVQQAEPEIGSVPQTEAPAKPPVESTIVPEPRTTEKAIPAAPAGQIPAATNAINRSGPLQKAA
jgi:hypothetical protein